MNILGSMGLTLINKENKMKALYIISILMLHVLNTANAGVIWSASGATIDFGGPGFGSISDTYNQSGLDNGYVSGVTDFDTYIATDPQHTSVYNGNEWFSREYDSPAGIAMVTYDLGIKTNIDSVALWNEESSGIGILDLFGSLDGVNFFDIALNLIPRDNFYDENKPNGDYPYSAEVFAITNSYIKYIRFGMSGCPQQPSSFNYCSIGEVAFSIADDPKPNEVSAPPHLFLFLFILFIVGMVIRRPL